MSVRVASASESAAIDAAAISGGIPSRALMRVAAANAATLIAARCGGGSHAVTVYTGPGNNGADGWAVARSLTLSGVRVDVREIVGPASVEGVAERAAFRECSSDAAREGTPHGVVVDALLGTGSTGVPRGAIADAVREINARRDRGAFVIALDVPTGLDATSGEADGSVRADLTISFGTCKRGTLSARGACGEIAVVDIGLAGMRDELPLLVDGAFVRGNTPVIPATAHKGTRGKLAIVAGGAGLGGAAILAAEGALRSGIGLVKVFTDEMNVGSLHARLPEALTGRLTEATAAISDWADAVLIGPGLGRDDSARALVHDVLESWRGPVVVDADALNVFDGCLGDLARLLSGRPALITPHPEEMARLVLRDVKDVLANRFVIGTDVARALGAAVLLKGTPTVITSPGGARHVVAAGTPALATGGSGDALGGMIATLLAQGCVPAIAAACAAWVHGRAAELTPGVRGFTLTDVLERLSEAWRLDRAAGSIYPVLAALPAVA
ncbi:MAG: NAD(P)H-hydrate dehydratase [Gemmatimonadaceae bacterium]